MRRVLTSGASDDVRRGADFKSVQVLVACGNDCGLGGDFSGLQEIGVKVGLYSSGFVFCPPSPL